MNRTPLPALLAPALLLAGACRNDQIITEQDPQFQLSPTSLLDLGTTGLGGTLSGDLLVDHVHGPDGRILSVEIGGDPDGHFAVGATLPLAVERGGRGVIPIVFSSDEPGWFAATVTVAHDGLKSPFSLDVRAAALEPEVTVSPRFLDYGPVPDGAAASRQVTVSNLGDTALQVTDLFLSDGAFAADLELPVVVAAGRDLRIPLSFTAPGERAVAAELALYVGDLALPTVGLVANDCENGLPDAYDADRDGVTSCGGDCDDGREDVRPGAVEVADGVDQDCDRVTDEGTTSFDDDGDGWTEYRGDCNDGDRDVSPDGTEVLGNGVDDDCDGVVDVGGVDDDGDGYSTGGGDCDDGDASVFPGAPETSDGVDDDCDTAIDEGTPAVDDDGDGYCESLASCFGTATPGDCDDGAPVTHPSAAEAADGRDNDCDGLIDEGTPNRDDDGDGYSELGGDCDDADPARSPAAGC